MLMKKRQLSAKFFTSFTMASKSRRCLNYPNRFCNISGEYTYCKKFRKSNLSGEQGERVHQDIKTMEVRYQGRSYDG
jgi:hypothetical protein